MKAFLIFYFLLIVAFKANSNLSIAANNKLIPKTENSMLFGSKHEIGKGNKIDIKHKSSYDIFKRHQSFTESQIPIIPLPKRYDRVEGNFQLNRKTQIVSEDLSTRQIAYFLQKELLRCTGIPVRIQTAGIAPSIVLKLNNLSHENNDKYAIQMTAKAVTITASNEQGLFYGVISLLQMARKAPVKDNTLIIDCWDVEDSPRYSWRGIMLDESRHFFGKEKVKSFLDWMAFYKLNRFHWHLTDQPGWRFEIKQYPKLALVGGIGNFTDSNLPAKYYTQEDIKEIVQYAAERYISIIPEIDMPGHATAANHAYPEFSGGGTELYPEFTFNPGKESTYQYLTNILSETDVLFPSQMIHIGGDEVHYGNKSWETDVDVKSIMKNNHLADVKAVEHYFIRRMADSVIKLNNIVLAWDEVVEASPPIKETIVFWWRQDKPEVLKKALDKGYSVVLCPRLPLYFDFVQDSTHKVGRKAAYPNSLERVYAFSHELIPEAVKGDKLILGIQANLWTETVITEQRFDYLFFPRICALSEAAWTETSKKNFGNFTTRLNSDLELFKKQGVYYFSPGSSDKNEPER